MKIAAYCRVSTDKDEQLDSLAHQKEFFIQYAQKNGYELFRLYADEGISGTSLKRRTEFQHLMADAAQGLFHMVVVKDISRFARNTVDALQSIRTLKALGISTLFLTANMDSMGDSEFILTLFSAMAQEESSNLSKRVKWGKRINAEKGRVPQQLFGYIHVDTFTLEIHPEEAAVVREIFDLYCTQGLGCRSISAALNRQGAKTKLGGEWNPRGVRRVLTNPIYCGILINHKYEIQDFLTGKQVALPREEQFSHQRPSWAIVSPQCFQRAQELLESRRAQFNSGPPFRESRYSGKHRFSTLIKCRHCGRSFTRKLYTYVNTRVYWRCVTNEQYTDQRCDNRTILDEPELAQKLGEYLTALIPDQTSFASQILAKLRQTLGELPGIRQHPAELEAKRRRLLSKMERYQELYANRLMTMEQLQEKAQAIARELHAYEAALEQLERGDAPEHPIQALLPQLSQEIQRFLTLETATNGDLRRILDHICVSKDGQIQVVLRKL